MHLPLPRNRLARIGLALLVANELRGVCVVAVFLIATHGRVF